MLKCWRWCVSYIWWDHLISKGVSCHDNFAPPLIRMVVGHCWLAGPIIPVQNSFGLATCAQTRTNHKLTVHQTAQLLSKRAFIDNHLVVMLFSGRCRNYISQTRRIIHSLALPWWHRLNLRWTMTIFMTTSDKNIHPLRPLARVLPSRILLLLRDSVVCFSSRSLGTVLSGNKRRSHVEVSADGSHISWIIIQWRLKFLVGRHHVLNNSKWLLVSD